jgi:hypothetical protein
MRRVDAEVEITAADGTSFRQCLRGPLPHQVRHQAGAVKRQGGLQRAARKIAVPMALPVLQPPTAEVIALRKAAMGRVVMDPSNVVTAPLAAAMAHLAVVTTRPAGVIAPRAEVVTADLRDHRLICVNPLLLRAHPAEALMEADGRVLVTEAAILLRVMEAEGTRRLAVMAEAGHRMEAGEDRPTAAEVDIAVVDRTVVDMGGKGGR